jgi:hypothetical protein
MLAKGEIYVPGVPLLSEPCEAEMKTSHPLGWEYAMLMYLIVRDVVTACVNGPARVR